MGADMRPAAAISTHYILNMLGYFGKCNKKKQVTSRELIVEELGHGWE